MHKWKPVTTEEHVAVWMWAVAIPRDTDHQYNRSPEIGPANEKQ